MKNKIFCIADSLGLPGHLNKYEDTWFYKLKQEFPNSDFISFYNKSLYEDGCHPNVFGQNVIYNRTKDLLNEFN
tara:strand:- start:1409 stop:1630 length:222 start_codon:yes stop_codon:yes gene_type:complete